MDLHYKYRPGIKIIIIIISTIIWENSTWNYYV